MRLEEAMPYQQVELGQANHITPLVPFKSQKQRKQNNFTLKLFQHGLNH